MNSHKHKIRRLKRQIRDKDVEDEKTCSRNARDKVIHQLQAKLKKKDEEWKMENERLHGVTLVLRFLFSILEVLLLFLWSQSARRTILNILSAVVFFNEALTATWLVMIVSNIVAGI